MSWKEFEVTGKNSDAPIVTIGKSGMIRFNKFACKKYLKDCNRIKIFVDKPAKKVALKPSQNGTGFKLTDERSINKHFTAKKLVEYLSTTKGFHLKLKTQYSTSWDNEMQALILQLGD